MPSQDRSESSLQAQYVTNRFHAKGLAGAAAAVIFYTCDSLPWLAIKCFLFSGLIASQFWFYPVGQPRTGHMAFYAVLYSIFALILNYVWSMNAMFLLYQSLNIYTAYIVKAFQNYFLIDSPLEDTELEDRELNWLCLGYSVTSLLLLWGFDIYDYCNFMTDSYGLGFVACIWLTCSCISIFTTDSPSDAHNPGYSIWRTWRYFDVIMRDLRGWTVHKMKWRIRELCEDRHKNRIGFDSLCEFDYADCPIKPNQIRLVFMERRCLFSGLLKLEVSAVAREESTECNYEAFSYTWGKDKVRKPVLLNGRRFFIQRNLYELLYARTSIKYDRVIWADAICIDQSKTGRDEKTIQIEHMKEIYINAYRVIAWLGDSYNAEMAARMVLRICTAFNIWGGESDNFYKTLEWQGYEWEAFFKTFSNAYFSRAWVCQEAGLGESLQFFVGGHYLRPGKIYTLLHLFYVVYRDLDRPLTREAPHPVKLLFVQFKTGRSFIIFGRLNFRRNPEHAIFPVPPFHSACSYHSSRTTRLLNHGIRCTLCSESLKRTFQYQ
jgi:hypothetical protein